MNFNLASILFLFGGFQAIILLIGINIKKPFYSDLKKITSLLLLDIVLVTAYYLVLIQGNQILIPFVGVVGNVSWMSITPLFYLLVKSLADHQWTLKFKHLTYFLCPLIFLFECAFRLVGIGIWQYTWIDSSQEYLDMWMFLFFSSSLFFLSKSIFELENQDAESDNHTLKWFTYIFMAVVVFFSITYLFIRTQYTSLFEYLLMGLMQAFVFILIYRIFKVVNFQQFFDLKKYRTQTLDKNKLALLASKLENVMSNEHLYLDEKLSLAKLAEKLQTTSNDLSQLFNLYYNSNFYEFVNRYRVGHLEKLILDPSNDHFKIIALAEQSGFKSKTTFYKAFKEKHQITPLQFVKKHKK